MSFAARTHQTRRQLRKLQQELIELQRRLPTPSRSSSALLTLLAALAALLATYHFSGDFRRLVLAGQRCFRVGWAVVRCMVDYKMLFRKTWAEDEAGKAQRHDDYEACHLGCAIRLREVLKKNGGIYIKVSRVVCRSLSGTLMLFFVARATSLCGAANPASVVAHDAPAPGPVPGDPTPGARGTFLEGDGSSTVDVLLNV